MSVRLHHEDQLDDVHEINVTPFIDVILVLLIIFMVAAPLATVDISVDLPASTAEPQPRPEKPVFLTVKNDLSLALGEDVVARDLLGATLGRATNGDKEARIFVRADRAVPYGELMEVMNLLRATGYLKVALVGLEKTPGTMTVVGANERREIARWAISAVAVVLVHAGAAAALVTWEPGEPALPAAALVIDLAPLAAAPPAPEIDVAPGPQQEQQDTPPEPAIKTAVIPPPEPEPPPPEPEPPPPPPEVIPPKPEVAIAEPPPKPPEAPKPKPKPRAKMPLAPKPSQQLAEAATAPTQGQPTVTNSFAIPNWRSQLVAHLERHKRYPSDAQARRETGVAQLAFSIDRNGAVTSARVVHSSGYPSLDEETLAMVRRASPVPAPPPEMGGSVALTVPVRFNMR